MTTSVVETTPEKFSLPRIRKAGIVLTFVLAVNLVSVCYAALVSAEGEENEVQALPGLAPTIDGYAESVWDDAGEYQGLINNQTRITLKTLMNGSYLYFLVTVQTNVHEDDEYVALLGSNTTDHDQEDLVDLKRVGLDNTTEDAHLVSIAAGFNVDTDQNVTGAASLYPDPAVHNWTVYEFKIPIASNDSDDVNWVISRNYAAKLGLGSGAASDYSNLELSEYFSVQVGPREGEENVDLGEFQFDWKVFLYVVFGVIFGIYGLMSVVLVKSRVKREKPKEQPGSGGEEEREKKKKKEKGTRDVPADLTPEGDEEPGSVSGNESEGKKPGSGGK
ncbi:MAG: hypothetical protein ACTSU5_04025 [Promethearchaeota archaeon]